MKYTVQNAPFPLKQLNWLYGFITGGLMFLIFLLIRLTQRVEYIGEENLSSSQNHIYAFWHDNLPLHFTANLRMKKPQIWLQHPMLFMKPIHIMVKMMGLTEMAYGSSGNKGKVALERVNAQLKNSYSTMINPDGPAGPIKKLKVGVLIMAKETGVPIIPITMDASPKWVMNTWDKKKQPLPFSKIRIEYHEPIYIRENFDDKDIEHLETILSKP
ncbi:MAG: lysophospholipid acyltransferase (LPLAT)-like uncharacterized protein [Bacteroidia bacterium]|jgi:lysophospholipid acyltransferase (LPLAT)-like uncharacterized protein